MLIDDFRRRCQFLHRMTVDFVEIVPDNRWEFSPDPPRTADPREDPLRHGDGFAPFAKQVRHVVCVRGVYNEAMVTGRADFSRKHDHYTGRLTRGELSEALFEKQRDLLERLETVDTEASIEFFGRPFSFGEFAYDRWYWPMVPMTPES